MTDGIIQQVFNSHRLKDDLDVMEKDLIDNIEQELIEKIKQEFKTQMTIHEIGSNQPDGRMMPLDEVHRVVHGSLVIAKEKLIGDNQE